MRSTPRALAIATAAIVAASCQPSSSSDMPSDSSGPRSGPITLAVVNARVWTGDSARPWAEALAVRDDRIATVGSSAAVRKLAGNARIVDARGKLVVPG